MCEGDFWLFMRGRNDWTPWTTPNTLTPNTQCQSSNVHSSRGLLNATPALLHKMLTWPNSENATAASDSTASGSVTSQTTAEARTPNPLASSATACAERSSMSAT